MKVSCSNSTGFFGEFPRIFLEEGIIHGILGFSFNLVMKYLDIVRNARVNIEVFMS